jgi:hypothetical protein
MMAKCDLCGGECRPHELQTLLDSYQVDGVKDICPACAKWANKTKGDLLGGIAPQMRDAIAAQCRSQPPPLRGGCGPRQTLRWRLVNEATKG